MNQMNYQINEGSGDENAADDNQDYGVENVEDGIFGRKMQQSGKPSNFAGQNFQGDTQNQQLLLEDIEVEVDESAFNQEQSRGEFNIGLGRSQTSETKIGGDKMQGSRLAQSVSGFDIGKSKQVGAFFSSIRQQKEGEKTNFFTTENMKGQDYVDRLIKQQEDRYQKKFAFERSQFHQCIPNPTVENQMITVQKVVRVLEGLNNKTKADHNEFDNDNDELMMHINTLSQKYQRYRLAPPDADEDEMDRGEGEGEDGDDLTTRDRKSNISARPNVVAAVQAQDNGQGLTRAATQYGNSDLHPELFKEANLNENVDLISGVAPIEYAKVVESASQDLAVNAFMNCAEYAVIGFWDLDTDDRFQCTRFFIVPNPMVRNIKDSEGTTLDQILYTSNTTKDIFFFFKGYLERGGDDLDDVTPTNDYQLQVAFLNLTMTVAERNLLGESRHIYSHCKIRYPIKDGNILSHYINELNDTNVNGQEQMPNPTVIETVGLKGELSSGKTIVFTAFLKEGSTSKEKELQELELLEQEESVEPCWYPTIFFFDLEKQQTVWEIFGAEQFIHIDKARKVTVLTNEIWIEIEEEEYQAEVEKDANYNRHWSYANYIRRISYGAYPPADEMRDRDTQAPEVPTLNSFRLNFGISKNLEITTSSQVVEAHGHNNGERVTLLYRGLGAFTFQMKQAKSLQEPNEWSCNYRNRKFHTSLKFSPDRISAEGTGADENEELVTVKIRLDPQDTNNWSGFYDTEDEMCGFFIEALSIQGKEISADWQDDDGCQRSIIGSIGARVGQQKSCNFKLTDSSIDRTRIFKGKIDNNRSVIRGKWYFEDDESPEPTKYHFQFNLADKVRGTVQLTFNRGETITEDIEMDFKEKWMISPQGNEKTLELDAIDAKDQAELTFFILQPDVSFVKTSTAAYVQAKLNSIADEDINSNGMGVCETSLTLYQVSEPLKVSNKGDKTGNKNKKKAAKEPRTREHLKFYLGQTFLLTQEKKESQLWNVNNSMINSQGRFFGSIIYEEYGTDELSLNFFSSQLKGDRFNDVKENDEEVFDYPQSPVEQTWMVDYPLMAYKTFTPMNREIAIIHLAQNMPQRLIHLGDWEFVCFVNHTQMVEQKLFKKQKETNCDIMFLVRRQGKIRLVSYKSNPWLKFDEEANDADADVYKQSLFMFSGSFEFMQTEDFHGEKIVDSPENRKMYSRRFNNDKIQSVQLITKTLGSFDQFMLIIQFNDCIVQTSLEKTQFKIICEPEAMVRRHLVRGYNEKVFFAESSGNAEKIQQLEFHSSKPTEIVKKEIFQLAGSWLVAFEPDCELMENDTEEVCTQRLFIMDDSQKIYHLENADNIRFDVKQVIDFSPHEKIKEIAALALNDWTHVHVTTRTLTFGEKIYNLNSKLSIENSVPKIFFGEEKKGEASKSQVQSNDDEEDDTDSEAEEEAQYQNEWVTQSVQGMSMTANMITQCQRQHREFCFVVKPAPGSRKINIVGYQQLHEIEQMLFVSNNHVLMKFRGGKAVTLLSNGCIIHQTDRVQRILEENTSVVGESQIFKGKKTVLLLQEYGETLEKERFVALQFNSEGLAELVGIFDEPYEQMKKVMAKFAEASNQMAMNFPQMAAENDQDQITRSVQGGINNIIDGVASAMGSKVAGQKSKKTKIKYAKEYFVTEKGEVIKMAAIVTQDPEIINKLQLQKGSDIKGKHKKKQEVTAKQSFISVFSVDNNQQTGQQNDNASCVYKVIVFHCLDVEEQKMFQSNTQYCVVGNYLCHRAREAQTIFVTKLKEEDQNYIPVSSLVQNSEDGLASQMYKEYQSNALSIKEMVNNSDLEHIQMTEVPKAYFKTIKKRVGNEVQFFDNLLQVTIRADGMIFDLDSTPIQEVSSIENIDSFQDPDATLNTGFIMSTSKNEEWEEETFLQRKQLFTNEHVNLLFEKRQDRYKSGERENFISGMLFRTFAEVDLFAMKEIFNAINGRQKIPITDPQSYLCIYEGHTVFSIFFDCIEVYEQILAQMQDMEFEQEEDLNGLDIENTVLRKLYRILNLPTTDFLHKKAKRKSITEQQVAADDADAERQQEEEGCFRSALTWLRTKFRIGVAKSKDKGGFQTITKKSLHFQSARYRESLMEISMLCQENSISDFVDNLEDIELMFTSMSPAVVEFFENGYNVTRFTKKVKNLDWQLGNTLSVIGQQQSVITQKQANLNVNDGKVAKVSDKIQNRQVEVQLLQIDWVFAAYKGNEISGFRELVVALSKAPNESLFSTDLVVTLVDHFWERYYNAIFMRCFIPYVIYFATAIYYVSNYTVEGIDPEDRWAMTPEFFMRWIILVSVIYFAFFEFICILRDGLTYFTDVFNYVDWGAFVLNLWLLYATSAYQKDEDNDRTTIRTMAAVSVFLMWIKSFYWMRLFTDTSFYVRLIRETLFDIRYFLILFIFILMTFGNTLMVIAEGRDKGAAGAEGGLYQDIFSIRFLNVVFNQYMLSLGEFDLDNYQGEGNDALVWTVFIATTFITQITFLNMLIAIMGDTFARVSEVKDQSALKEKIEILSDYVIAVQRESHERNNLYRYIFAIRPKTLGSDEGSSWEGTVTQLKKALDTNSKQMKLNFNRKFSAIQSEVQAVSSRVTALDDKIVDLTGVQQKLPTMADMERSLPSMSAIEQVMRRLMSEQKNGGLVSARVDQIVDEDEGQRPVINDTQSNMNQTAQHDMRSYF